MKFTARVIADFLGGVIEGDENIEVNNVSKIEEGKQGTLSFIANPKYEHYLYTSKSSIILVNKSLKINKAVSATLIKVDDAYKSFASLLELYQQSLPKPSGISANSTVSKTAKIGKDVYIGEYTVISDNAEIGENVRIYPQVYIAENVKIGDNTIIYPGVIIYNNSMLGKNCIVHAGVVIGADGFGFVPQNEEEHKKVPQIGNVIIEDNVEIGANTTIDRATLGSTIIRKGVKLDNLIQIAHNVEIGEKTFMAAQCGVSGSTKIGKECLIGGQVGFAGHLHIADKVKIGAQAGIASNIKEEGIAVQGTPAISIMNFQKSSIVYKMLPQLNRQINQMQREIDELKAKIMDN